MAFNSIDFMIFFPIVIAIFFIIPKKLRYMWLLLASYYFYMSWNPKYAILIATSTLITYISGILIESSSVHNKINNKKIWLAGSLISNIGILVIFKYANFFLSNLNKIMELTNLSIIDYRFDLLLPVGISFYTFQALSYSLDVYKGEIKAEKNLFKYALFVSFFPQLVAGPIERSKNLLIQIQNIDKIKVWNFDRVRDGFLLMLWGLFQKLVIADRAAIIVNNVINKYNNYGFVEISIAIVLFAFQIYCDFSGYTNIARGAARVMGFSLMDNFKQPYFAKSIKEFWRRWHISLTSWFTDYLYIPLGGNRKGTLRKYINTLIVFCVSGLWHGASWNFIVWGLVHAVYQICGDLKQKIKNKYCKTKIDINTLSFSAHLRKTFITFLLVDFAWIFFASSSLRHALGVITQMFSKIKISSIYDLGLDSNNLTFLFLSLLVLLFVDIMHEKKISIITVICKQECWFRWIIYVCFVWIIIMFGIYGVSYDTSTFIYFQF